MAIATALQQIDKLVEEQKMDMRIRGIQGAVVIKDTDLKSVYKKIVTLLEKA